MYEIKVKASFSAAHNLKNYRGKCERLHGHNWNIEAVFAFAALGADGIALDFRRAKEIVHDVIDAFDHTYLNEVPRLHAVNPTSENIARAIFTEIRRVEKHIASVSVWENENACATYREARR